MKKIVSLFFMYKVFIFCFFLSTPFSVNANLTPINYPLEAPLLTSDNSDFNQLYQLAINTVQKNIVNNDETEKTIITAGDLWQELWTRDLAYSGLFALNFLTPSLIQENYYYRLFENYDIIQDSSTEIGDWPIQTDKIVLLVSWYDWLLINGRNDDDFTEFIKIANQTLISAPTLIFDNFTWLFKGVPSIIDSFSAFPIEYQTEKSDQFINFKSLSTNLLYWKAYQNNCNLQKYLSSSLDSNQILSTITDFDYCQFAQHLKKNIENYFWQNDKNYYGSFLNENNQLNTSFDSLGNSLALYWNFLKDQNLEKFVKNTPWQKYGLPFRYPYYQLGENGSDKPWYQNSTVWPVTSHFMHLSLLKRGLSFIFEKNFFQSTQTTLTENDFNELYDATWGYKVGSSNQLWSATAFLGIIYQGILGLNFSETEISFSPCLPKNIPNLKIDNLALTPNLNLKIEFKGTGCKLESAILVSNLQGEQSEGTLLEKASFPKELTGNYKLIFIMNKIDKTTQFLNNKQKEILPLALKNNLFISNKNSLQPIDKTFFYLAFFNKKYSLPIIANNYWLANFNKTRNLYEPKLNFNPNQQTIFNNLLFNSNQNYYTYPAHQTKELFYFNKHNSLKNYQKNNSLRKIDFLQILDEIIKT